MELDLNLEKALFYALTLTVVDPDDETKTIEYYPKTFADGVYLDKYQKQSIVDWLRENHIMSEDFQRLLRSSDVKERLLMLDEHGYIPMKYLDNLMIALYVEYINIEDMISTPRYDAIQDHGRLVLVKDARNSKVLPKYKNLPDPYWAVFRLVGNDAGVEDSWQLIFHEHQMDQLHTWEEIATEFRSSIEEIDDMVRNCHHHDNHKTLAAFEDRNGQLYWHDKRIIMRNEINAIIATRTRTNISEGDLGLHITFSQTYKEKTPFIPETPITLYGNATGYFEDHDIKQAPLLDTRNATILDRFFANCRELESIRLLELDNVVSAVQMCINCDKLKRFPAITNFKKCQNTTSMMENCTSLVGFPGLDADSLANVDQMFKNCLSLEYIGNFANTQILTAREFLRDCRALKRLPTMKLDKAQDLYYAFAGCENITDASVNTRMAENMDGLFYGCSKLKRVYGLDFGRCRHADDIFVGCYELEYVDIIPGTLRVSLSFGGTNLSIECAEKIITELPSVRTATLYISSTPASRISNTYITLASSKGWQIAR